MRGGHSLGGGGSIWQYRNQSNRSYRRKEASKYSHIPLRTVERPWIAFRLFNDVFLRGIWTLAEGGEVIAKFAPEDVARLIEVKPGVCQWLDGNGQPIEAGF
jgi:hypothetical protein